jgi:regulator-associated protein of mTOR
MDSLRLENISEDQDEEGKETTSHSRDNRRKRVISLPQGVNQMIMERFEKCWKALRLIQHDDPHPNVSAAANSIVRVVHETLYDMRMELDARTKGRSKVEGGLTGIQEEGEIGSDGMDRVKSDANINLASPDPRGNISVGAPQSDGPSDRLPKIKPKPYPLRRSASETPGGNFPSISIGDAKSLPSLTMPGRNLMDRVKAENLLPKSEFYNWKKSIFRPDYDDEDLEDREDQDPLNPLGAARNYQHRRNAIVRDEGNKLGRHFVELKPRRETQKKSLDMLLNDDNDDEKDDMDAILQSELKLQEKQLLRNTSGVKMTSMLKFHSYENALAVFDNQDYISIWDYDNGARKSSFKNGNPVGSRMTSAFWINESSTSLLFVGCDDGSARIWNGIVRDSGQISTEAPTLSSSFYAVPNMEAGQPSKSGLICEWQQTSGTLISGKFNSPIS